jgi:hypothetical protein
VCTYVFLLHQESFDMILVNNPSFHDRGVTVVDLNSNCLGWHHIFTHCYCDHLVAAMSDRGHYTSPLLLGATTAMTIWVISLEPIATKGHNSDLPMSPTSLAQNETDRHKYLLTTQQIDAVTTNSLEILDYSWTSSSSFYRAHNIDISSLYTPNLGAASIYCKLSHLTRRNWDWPT